MPDSRRPLCFAAALVVAGAIANPALGQIGRLGAVGDSLSDEYSEETYSYAKNWTMQVVQYRAVNMGPTAAQAGQPGGSWGEPRRTGYGSNWARSGADSATLLSQGQHTGLAAQVVPGGVTHAVMAIGANDFSPDTSAYLNIYFGFWSQSTIDSYVNSRIANVEAAVQVLDASGVKLALGNFVDYGVAPVTRQYFSNASRRDRVTAVIHRVNDGIELIAQQHRIVLVDLNALGTAIFGTNSSLRQYLPIGNVNIQLFNKDTTSNSNPLAGFVDDGAHPHTTLQGVFANVMMTALDVGFNAGLVPFTDQEILAHAGIAYGGSDTLLAQIGPYAGFVRSYVCRADIDNNNFVNGDDFDTFIGWFEQGDAKADFDGNSFVNGDDFDSFVEAFQAGC